MSNLTSDELARLRLKAKHGTLTPEEQQAYNDYVTEQLSAVPSPPSGAVPPKKGFKWESEKVAEWRLKARHDGLDENERLLYQDYQQTLALAEADANASEAKFTGESSERQLKNSAILRGVMSLALVVLIGMYAMTGCKLSEPESGRFPGQCFFDEVVSGLRGTSDMTEVRRHIWSDEAMRNFGVYSHQKEDPSYDPGPYVPYDGNDGGKQTIEDLGNG